MKTQLTDFYCAFFNSKRLERAGLILAIVGVTYFIAECAISVIQKW